ASVYVTSKSMRVSLLPDDRLGGARQLDDVQARVRAVREIDEAAVVDLDVVGLDGDLAAIVAVDLHAALVGAGRHRRDEERGLARIERIADVDRAHAAVEVRDEDQLPVV